MSSEKKVCGLESDAPKWMEMLGSLGDLTNPIASVKKIDEDLCNAGSTKAEVANLEPG